MLVSYDKDSLANRRFFSGVTISLGGDSATKASAFKHNNTIRFKVNYQKWGCPGNEQLKVVCLNCGLPSSPKQVIVIRTRVRRVAFFTDGLS